MFGLGKGRGAGACAAMMIAAGALVVVGSSPAGAISVSPSCDAFAQDANGNPTGAPLAEDVSLPPLEVPSLGNATVETGTAFEAVANGSSVNLPSGTNVEFPPGSGTVLAATVNEVKNIKMTFHTTGAAGIGTPALSGGNVIGASAIVNGNDMTLTLPGSQNGSTIPGGGAFFPGGSTFNSPKLVIPVTAPNSPGTISTALDGMTLAVKVTIPSLGNLALGIALVCDASATIGTVTVEEPPPPPPGAPDAVNDNASTNVGEPVTVNVLENDTPNAEFPIDEDSLAITVDPTKGSVVINADHSVTYTPNEGETGVDSFKYKLCSLVDLVDIRAAQQEEPCDEATVSITINDPSSQTTTTTTPATTVAPAGSTDSTVAPAANELPRTGSSNAPLAAFGFGLCLLGGLALAIVRRRATA